MLILSAILDYLKISNDKLLLKTKNVPALWYDKNYSASFQHSIFEDILHNLSNN